MPEDEDCEMPDLVLAMKSSVGKRPVRVHLLNGESLLLVFDPRVTLIKEVLSRVCKFCKIENHQYFGLTKKNENENEFLEPERRIRQYAPKDWANPPHRKTSQTLRLTSVFELDFKVQFFVEHPDLIKDPHTRHNYYLQMKRNVLKSQHQVNDEVIFQLAASSLHIECGKFDVKLHVGSYFNPHEHVPQWFIQKWKESFVIANLPKAHKDMVKTTAHHAMGNYIYSALCLDDVSAHFYRLHKSKGEKDASVIMAVHHKGVSFTHTNPILYLNYEWSQIGRITFKKRKFEIYPSDVDRVHRLTYYSSGNAQSQYFLRTLRNSHSIYMSLQPFMQVVRKQQSQSARPDFRVSYIYGIDPDGAEREVRVRNLERDGIILTSQKEEAKVSRGSSHTSGIESDSKGKDDTITNEEEKAEESQLVVSLLRSESTEDLEQAPPHSGGGVQTTTSLSSDVFLDTTGELPDLIQSSPPQQQDADVTRDSNEEDKEEEEGESCSNTGDNTDDSGAHCSTDPQDQAESESPDSIGPELDYILLATNSMRSKRAPIILSTDDSYYKGIPQAEYHQEMQQKQLENTSGSVNITYTNHLPLDDDTSSSDDDSIEDREVAYILDDSEDLIEDDDRMKNLADQLFPDETTQLTTTRQPNNGSVVSNDDEGAGCSYKNETMKPQKLGGSGTLVPLASPDHHRQLTTSKSTPLPTMTSQTRDDLDTFDHFPEGNLASVQSVDDLTAVSAPLVIRRKKPTTNNSNSRKSSTDLSMRSMSTSVSSEYMMMLMSPRSTTSGSSRKSRRSNRHTVAIESLEEYMV